MYETHLPVFVGQLFSPNPLNTDSRTVVSLTIIVVGANLGGGGGGTGVPWYLIFDFLGVISDIWFLFGVKYLIFDFLGVWYLIFLGGLIFVLGLISDIWLRSSSTLYVVNMWICNCHIVWQYNTC